MTRIFPGLLPGLLMATALFAGIWGSAYSQEDESSLAPPKRLSMEHVPGYLGKLAGGAMHEVPLARKCLVHLGEVALPAIKKAYDEEFDNNPFLIQNLCEMFGEMNLSETVPLLHRALGHRFEKIQLQAMRSLEKLKPAKYPDLAGELGSLLVQRGLSMELKKAAADCLSAIETREAREALAKGLQARIPEIRLYVMERLGKLADPRFEKTFEDILKKSKEDNFARMRAKAALIRLGRMDLIDGLVQDLHLPEYTLGILAMQLLAEYKGKDAFPMIVHMIRSTHYTVISAAIKSLEKLGVPEAIPFIEEREAHNVPGVRWSAKVALYKLGKEEILDKCLEMVESGNVKNQDEALFFFKKLKIRDAVPAIIRGAKRGSIPSRRRRFMKTFEAIGDTRAVPVLVEFLKTDNRSLFCRGSLQKETARILSSFGDASVDPVAMAMQEAKDLRTKMVCVDALGRIGTQKAADTLRGFFPNAEDPKLKKYIKYWVERVELFL